MQENSKALLLQLKSIRVHLTPRSCGYKHRESHTTTMHQLIKVFIIILAHTHTVQPENLKANATTSSSIFVSWTAPSSNVMVNQYSVSCTSSGQEPSGQFNISSSQRNITLSFLLPHTDYLCCVTAENQNGQSSENCAAVTTLEDGISKVIL